MGTSKKWLVPNFYHNTDSGPLLREHVGVYLGRDPDDLRPDLIPVGEVLLERDLPAARPGHVRFCADFGGADPAGGQDQPRAGRRAEPRRYLGDVRGRELSDRGDAEFGELRPGLRADAPERAGGLVAEHLVPVLISEPEDASRLSESGRELGLKAVLADANAARQLRIGQ